MFGGYIDAALRGTLMRGGAELQMALIAKRLARHGVSVMIFDTEVTRGYSPEGNLTIEGIPHWNDGMRGVRLLSHRIPNLKRCLEAAHADVYYARGFSFVHVLMLYVAKRAGSKFILAVASDMDLMSFHDRYRGMYRRNASVWRWLSTIIPNEIAASLLIRGADVLLVQHETQRILARSRPKRVVVLNNLLGDDVAHVDTRGTRRNNLIVGSLSALKGLRVLLPLIKELQHVGFEFVGEPHDSEGRRIEKELGTYPNVVFHGALDRRKTLEAIAGAKALLNTSPIEGFPNTFLEAWALGTPVISLYVDPGGVIKSNRLGYVCDGDLGLFRDLLQRGDYNIDRDEVKKYALQHHGGDQVIRVFEGILE
jgi:glycosyltransferase involved in cell wall biosynthesis